MIAVTLLATLLGGCSFAPVYQRPATVTIPPSFKELPDWHAAAPSDAVARGRWWELFGDPVLTGLEAKVLVSNQNLASAKAAFDQARALVRQQRAALFPAVSLTAKGTDARSIGGGNASIASGNDTAYQLGLGASWEPDLWGAIGNSVSQAKAQAQASAGDLANATLSAQGDLALDYVQLRGIDQQTHLLDTTVADYARALAITTNRYKAGVAAQSDVDQAQTALSNARAQAQDLVRQRTALEHAIAVLVGENPSTFALAPSPWNPMVPDVPATIPSEILQRRPDIAAAERRVAAANANIGIQRAAAFPVIGLTAGLGTNASGLAGLFAAGTSAWSLGLTGVLSLLDFGANKAKVAGARAAWEQAVAQYRQTVLGAFQQTEDQLAAARTLREEAGERNTAAAAAGRAEAVARNQYVAGIIGYADVIVAQTAALSARVAEVQSVTDRQVAAISLIEAVGGHWDMATDVLHNEAVAVSVP
jgi:NodT family efflux transporter outer membrane factor (OMF) lipoprotein